MKTKHTGRGANRQPENKKKGRKAAESTPQTGRRASVRARASKGRVAAFSERVTRYFELQAAYVRATGSESGFMAAFLEKGFDLAAELNVSLVQRQKSVRPSVRSERFEVYA